MSARVPSSPVEWARAALVAVVLLPIWPIFGLIALSKNLLYTRQWFQDGVVGVIQHGRLFALQWRDDRPTTHVDPSTISSAQWHRWVVVSAFANDEEVDALRLVTTSTIDVVGSANDTAPLVALLMERGLVGARPTREWTVSPSGLRMADLFAWAIWLGLACAALVWWADRR